MHHIRFIPVLGVCLGAMLGTGYAMAAFPEEQEGVRFTAGGGLEYHDNLFLQPSASSLPGSTEKSDHVSTVYAGLLLDKSIDLQRFKLNATVNHGSYNRNSFLDYDTKNLTGVWQWAALGNRWKGDLGYEHTETPNNFRDYRPATTEVAKNIMTNRALYFSGGYGLLSDWQVRFHAADRKSTNSVPIRADSDIETKTFGVGARYQPTPENFVEGLLRHGRGNYFNSLANSVTQVDSSFDDDEFELTGQWRLTGKSTLNATAKYIDWSYPTFTARDFSGWAGGVDHHWSITGKTSLHTALYHDLYPYIDVNGARNSSYVSGNRFSLEPEWAATAKITLRATLSRALRDFRGQLAGGAPRNDALNIVGLTVEYRPVRVARLSASVQRLERSGNFTELNFSDRVVSLNADVAF